MKPLFSLTDSHGSELDRGPKTCLSSILYIHCFRAWTVVKLSCREGTTFSYSSLLQDFLKKNPNNSGTADSQKKMKYLLLCSSVKPHSRSTQKDSDALRYHSSHHTIPNLFVWKWCCALLSLLTGSVKHFKMLSQFSLDNFGMKRWSRELTKVKKTKTKWI